MCYPLKYSFYYMHQLLRLQKRVVILLYSIYHLTSEETTGSVYCKMGTQF
jgi:hypothetical protein